MKKNIIGFFILMFFAANISAQITATKKERLNKKKLLT